MAEKKRKYLLFTKADGRADAQKPCAFFISAAGCRNGAGCQFSHGDDHPTLATKVIEKVVEKEVKEVKVKKVVKKIEPPSSDEESEEEVVKPVKVVKAVKVVPKEVKEVKVVKVVKREVAEESYAATVPQNSKYDDASILQALEAQKQQFELEMRKQREAFQDYKVLLQKNMQLQQKQEQEQANVIVVEKTRQKKQEEFQIEEDKRLVALKARQAAHQLATGQTSKIVKEDRRHQTQLQNKRRKSNESLPQPIQPQQQQQHTQPPPPPTQPTFQVLPQPLYQQKQPIQPPGLGLQSQQHTQQHTQQQQQPVEKKSTATSTTKAVSTPTSKVAHTTAATATTVTDTATATASARFNPAVSQTQTQ